MTILQIEITKRQKIIIVSVLLSFGLLGSTFIPYYLRYWYITGLAALSYLLSLWSLWVGISKLKAVVLMILPTFFTLAVTGFYFLLVSDISRVGAAVVFGLIFYTLLLSQNVFNVSSLRTIPLYRAASTTVYVLTVITVFLLLNVIFSLEMLFIWNGLWTFLISFPMILQVLWSIEMEKVDSVIIVYSFLLSLVTSEVAIGYSFWPTSGVIKALVVTLILSVVLGISTHTLRDRLKKGEIWLYIGWGIGAFILALLTTSWIG